METIESYDLSSFEFLQENEMLQVLGGNTDIEIPVEENAEKCNKCDKCDKCTWFCG